jgi:hypothetical protein
MKERRIYCIILLTCVNDIGEKSESMCTNRFNKIFY